MTNEGNEGNAHASPNVRLQVLSNVSRPTVFPLILFFLVLFLGAYPVDHTTYKASETGTLSTMHVLFLAGKCKHS